MLFLLCQQRHRARLARGSNTPNRDAMHSMPSRQREREQKNFIFTPLPRIRLIYYYIYVCAAKVAEQSAREKRTPCERGKR